MKLPIIALFLLNLLAFNLYAEQPKLSGKEKRQNKKQLVQFNQLQWNFTEVSMYKENEELLSRLEKRFEQGQILGLELIIADSTDIRFESKWGHSMMRFVDNVRTSNNDITLGFIADLDTPKTNYIKGAIGGYPVFPVLKTMSGFVEQYIKGEDRALDRFIIPTTPEMLKNMISKLREIWEELKIKNYQSFNEQAQKLKKKLLKKYDESKISAMEEEGLIIGYSVEIDEKIEIYAVEIDTQKSKDLGGYTFLKNNCAGALINFLRETTFSFIGNLKWKGRVPNRLNEFLDQYYLSSFSKITIPAINEFKKKLEEITEKKYTDLNEFENWESIDIEKIITKLSLEELMLMMDQYNLAIPPEKADQFLSYLSSLENKPNYDQLYKIQTLPEILYRACLDDSCVKDQLEIAGKYFDLKETSQKINSEKKVSKKSIEDLYINELKTYNLLLKSVLKENL